jgi:hypothetical protein
MASDEELFSAFEDGFLYGAEIGMKWKEHPLTKEEAVSLLRQRFDSFKIKVARSEATLAATEGTDQHGTP